MDANLPPWLDTRPSDYTSELRGGMAAGAQLATLAMEHRNAEARQQMGFMELSQRKEQFDKEYQLKTAEMSVTAELRRETLKNQAVAMAQKYQSERAFQSKMDELVQGGMPYEQAYLQASMLTGANKPDLAAHFAAVSRENVADINADARRDTATKKPPIDEKEVRSIWADTFKSTGSTEEANKAVGAYRQQFGGGEGDGGPAAKPATERYKIVTGGGTGSPSSPQPQAEAPTGIPELDKQVQQEAVSKEAPEIEDIMSQLRVAQVGLASATDMKNRAYASPSSRAAAVNKFRKQIQELNDKLGEHYQ